MTKDEFKKALWAYGQERHCLGGEMSFEQRGIAVKSAGAIRKALLDTYDAMAARIAELEAERDAARAEAQARLESYNAEVDELNAGFDAYRAGLSLYDQPEVIYDVWRVGYAWAAYDEMTGRIAELEAALLRVLVEAVAEDGEGSMTRQCARAIDGAVALRPVRIFREKDELRYYTAFTFKDPHQGCDWWLRLLSSVGYVVDEADQMLDVLDENGDIIQEVPITRRGFEFLRSRWHFAWEREATWYQEDAE